MKRKIRAGIILSILILTTACDSNHAVNLPKYNVILTDDEYNVVFNHYMGISSHGYPYDNAKSIMANIENGFGAATVGRIDYEDTLEELPPKKSLSEILKRNAQNEWVEAGYDDGYKLNITMDSLGLTVLMTDTVNQNTVYEFNINTEILDDARRWNYLVYEIPGSDETIYFYCRREDYITVRTISGDYPNNYEEHFYNFIPKGTALAATPSISLQNIKIFPGYTLFEFDAGMKLNEENGVVSGTITFEEEKKLDSYQINFSGTIKDGILEFNDYELLHFARYKPFGDYLPQSDTISGLTGKIYFYRTFLLFEDAYTGNEYAFSFDNIRQAAE